MQNLRPIFYVYAGLPLLIICYYVIQLVEALKAGFPLWFGCNWGWVCLAVLIAAAPVYWKFYKSIRKEVHKSRDKEAYRRLVSTLTDQVACGAPLEMQMEGMSFRILSGAPNVGRGTTVIEEEEKQIEAPQVIKDTIKYEDIADQIPHDKALLGVHPATGDPELASWEKLKCVWLVGSSSTGKSNTIFGKALEAVKHGAKLMIVDPHALKEDSLARKLESLAGSFLAPIASKDEDILNAFSSFKQLFEARVEGADCVQRVVLICDECNRMARSEALRKPLQDIVAICGEESRGFGMYGWFLSQKGTHLKWLRDSAITVIAHRVTRIEEAKLICNDDLKAARKLLTFRVGRTFIYGVDFEEGLELQQCLYPVPLPAAKEAIGKGTIVSLEEGEKEILDRFLQGSSISNLVRDRQPTVQGGRAYQEAAADVADVLRKALKKEVSR